MSTAKTMAAQYKRTAATQSKSTLAAPSSRFNKSSTLARSTNGLAGGTLDGQRSRLKSTSMSNLIVENGQTPSLTPSVAKLNNRNFTSTSRLAGPSSRSAVDSIHNGMNAKYAGVQSKVLLQNIRPQGGGGVSRIPGSTLLRRSPTPSKYGGSRNETKVPNERTVMINKLKAQTEEIERLERERDQLRQEFERAKEEKKEQVEQLKQELQDKVAEHEHQNEEYHQKLLEAYELADENRRAADTVLAESRQRDEENRKKIDELEQQLGELREFVAMKEEMSNKMYELREQIRQERDRYEAQLKSLHGVFEKEKISNKRSEAFEREFKAANGSSNYFNRTKANLQSTESIDIIAAYHDNHQPAGDKCQRKHKSEHDAMYGSRLSTRMQDTAKSAWKAGKHFASSVITGAGGGLSACRKRDSKFEPAASGPAPAAQAAQIPVSNIVISTQPRSNSPTLAAVPDEDKQHTSVVEVGPLSLSTSPELSANGTAASVIKVDQNNKLTIVTKFNETGALAGCQSPATSSSNEADHETGAPISERSRCESSSSGRGTSSSDTNSAASQNGDSDCQAGGNIPINQQQTAADNNKAAKGHKRRSSLFKASKVFGGSQVSMNRLKSIFVGGNGATPATNQQVVAEGQQESSRTRCLELNQAIKEPSSCSTDQHHHQSSDRTTERGLEDGEDKIRQTTCDERQIECRDAERRQLEEKLEANNNNNNNNNNNEDTSAKAAVQHDATSNQQLALAQ